MPQFVLLAAAATAVYAGWRFLKREMTRVDARLDEVRVARPARPDAPTLVRDPETGVYRPRDDA